MTYNDRAEGNHAWCDLSEVPLSSKDTANDGSGPFSAKKVAESSPAPEGENADLEQRGVAKESSFVEGTRVSIVEDRDIHSLVVAIVVVWDESVDLLEVEIVVGRYDL
jgi:hypothetical protein